MTTLFISHSSKDKDWALRIRKALRKQGYQSLFLDSHPDDGIPAGADWEKGLYQKLRQSRGLVVLCTPNWLASPWCVAEAMMARERGRKVFMLATAEVTDERQVKASNGSESLLRIPDFLKDTQFIPLGGLTMEEAYERLWRGLKDQLRPQDGFPLPKRPYPGLEPFDENDAGVFFGRDHEIQRVESVLTQRRRNNAEGFILVLGASGCGKSSLVRAGVVPRLRHADGDGDAGGRWIIPRPILAGRGLEGLAVSLREAFKKARLPTEREFLRRRLEPARDKSGMERAAQDLREIANELLDAGGLPEGYVLLVLDQLEEVFGTAPGSDARAALRLLLDGGAADVGNRLVVLATMRSDFLDAFQGFPAAAGRYKEIPLDPMPPSRFGEVIEGPAERFGLRLRPGLTERLVEDTRHDDALPLLAYTLEQLYQKGGADGVLALEQYEGLFPEVSVREPDGTRTTYRGVSAAIKHVADEILREAKYDPLPASDPRMRDLRRAFYSLARVGTEGQFTRRVARRSQMPPSFAEGLLDRFVDRHLLVSGADDGERTITVAHEALFRVWDTLRDWLLGDRKALMLRAQIEDAAAEWDAENRAESRAWPEERILDAVREIGQSGASLDDVGRPDIVRAFVGPTDLDDLEKLPALDGADDDRLGSGLYGDTWHPPLSHEARASLGVRLALLGDPRPGVGLREDGLPDIEWRPIRGGEVTIEIRSSSGSELINRLTGAVEPFSMARYPVTVDQFQAFLEECYRGDQWRLPPGLPPPKHRARYGNHPADSVNWFDAVAFCHWLSARLGERFGTEVEVRLPTEFEWQLAATGSDPEMIYPWGPDWDSEQEPWRANTEESRLGRSTAVGMYPAGASKAGVLDLAGTVWEWCSNAFEDPDESGFPADAEDRRVLRGGSWNEHPGLARCALRLGINPHGRLSSIGFRVVCFSPIEVSDR